MLRITQNTSAPGAKKYFTVADYLSEGQESAGRWGGKGAQMLGLDGDSFDKTAFDRLCDNQHPLTGKPLTARQRADRTVGYDFTFDPPKGVSVLWEFTQDERLRDAFQAAVQETMQEIETAAQTRVRKEGRDENRTTGNLTWATFYHQTARPVGGFPDMNMHAHCFVFNATWDAAERQWKAAQFQDIKRDAPYWQAAFDARLAQRLQGLGYAIERKGKSWDVAGIPAGVLTKFSRRTAQIEAEAQRLGITNPEMKGEMGAKTREHKVKELSMDELRAVWRTRLSARELAAVSAVEKQTRTGGPVVPRVRAPEAVAWAGQHLFERYASVPVKRLLAEALRYGVGSVGVQQAWEAFRHGKFITATVQGRELTTTPEALAAERRLMALAMDGRGTFAPLQRGHVITDTRLNSGQRAAVQHLLASRDFVSIVIGDAGVGKTTLLKEAERGARQAGKQVFAFAPSAAAGRGVLREEGFQADTVAAFLANPQLQAQATGQIVLVDEAGLLGTKDAAAVLETAKRLQARVILVGDDKQHKAVSAGTPLTLLREKAGIPVIRVQEIQRQGGAYKDIVALAADGKPLAAFDKLDALGWVKELPVGERYQTLAGEYLAATQAAKGRERTALVVAPTHAEGDLVTAAIRTQLKEAGRLAAAEQELPRLIPTQWTEAERRERAGYQPGDVVQFFQHAKGHRRGERLTVENPQTVPVDQAARFQVYRPATLKLAVGDRVRVTQNGQTKDQKHRLNNGDLLTVAGFTPVGDVIDQRGWIIARDYGHLAYGYAVTSMASQGKTVDRVLIAQSALSLPASSRENFYVELSRGRTHATLYTDDKTALRHAIGKTEPRVSALDVAKGHARPSRIKKHLAALRRLLLQQPVQRGIDKTPTYGRKDRVRDQLPREVLLER